MRVHWRLLLLLLEGVGIGARVVMIVGLLLLLIGRRA